MDILVSKKKNFWYQLTVDIKSCYRGGLETITLHFKIAAQYCPIERSFLAVILFSNGGPLSESGVEYQVLMAEMFAGRSVDILLSSAKQMLFYRLFSYLFGF